MQWGEKISVDLLSSGHGIAGGNIGFSDLLALGLSNTGGSLAGKNGLAVLVELELLDDNLGGVNAYLDGLTWRDEREVSSQSAILLEQKTFHKNLTRRPHNKQRRIHHLRTVGLLPGDFLNMDDILPPVDIRDLALTALEVASHDFNLVVLSHWHRTDLGRRAAAWFAFFFCVCVCFRVR